MNQRAAAAGNMPNMPVHVQHASHRYSVDNQVVFLIKPLFTVHDPILLQIPPH